MFSTPSVAKLLPKPEQKRGMLNTSKTAPPLEAFLVCDPAEVPWKRRLSSVKGEKRAVLRSTANF